MKVCVVPVGIGKPIEIIWKKNEKLHIVLLW